MYNEKHILIIYAGGTIGCEGSAHGLRPMKPMAFTEHLKAYLNKGTDSLPRFSVMEMKRPIDSSSLDPKTWFDLALKIQSYKAKYDGFVLLHGTDTMAYTSSALSLLLYQIKKPVIVTGSMKPLMSTNSDAVKNIFNAVKFACSPGLKGVYLLFGNGLWRGARATKSHANDMEAFDAPNDVAVADTCQADQSIVCKTIEAEVELSEVIWGLKKPEVIVMRFFPGISYRFISAILAHHPNGVVIETYGAGNGPIGDRKILKAIKDACDRGTIFVAVTQCGEGKVNQGLYKAGKIFKDIGVLSGGDMTLEAAFTKLYCLLSSDLSPSRIKKIMPINLYGEVSP